jgi:hypothetical protein
MHAFGRGKRTLPVLPTQRAAAMELVVVRGDGESHVLHAREAKSRVHTGLIVVVRVEGITRHLRRKATDLHGGGGVSGGDGGVEGEARLQWRRIWWWSGQFLILPQRRREACCRGAGGWFVFPFPSTTSWCTRLHHSSCSSTRPINTGEISSSCWWCDLCHWCTILLRDGIDKKPVVSTSKSMEGCNNSSVCPNFSCNFETGWAIYLFLNPDERLKVYFLPVIWNCMHLNVFFLISFLHLGCRMDQGVKNKYICDPSVSASACKFYHISTSIVV